MSKGKCKTQFIRLQRSLPGVPWKVLRLISRISDFKHYMPNVKDCKILEKRRLSTITEWWVEIDGLPIHWRQKSIFDTKNFTIHFKAIEGDLQQFEGKWILTRGENHTTDVTVEVNARLGIPIFEAVVEDVLEFRLRKNFELMLLALEEELIRRRYHQVGSVPLRQHDVSGFVVMGHPYNFQHLVRIFRMFKPDIYNVTEDFLLKIFELAPSYHSTDIKNFRSAAGQVVDGHFVMCPIIPDMTLLKPEMVLSKVLEGCRIAEKLGAGVIALGGFTSIVGERYFDRLKSQVRIPITTGNAFTAAMALAGVRKAAELMDIRLDRARAAVIGGTGDIGSACARVLVREVSELVVTGRTPESLKAMEDQLCKEGGAKVIATLDNHAAVRDADIVIAAASSSHSIVDINQVKSGAVVCDVGYPKNLSYTNKSRQDILIFSGGLCSVPTPFNLGFDLGLPSSDILYGCFSEAIILALENRFENYSEGKGKLTAEKIFEIEKLGAKHGFTIAPFFWGDEIVDAKKIKAILASKVRAAS